MNDIDEGEAFELSGPRRNALVLLAVVMGIPLAYIVVTASLRPAHIHTAGQEFGRLAAIALTCALAALMLVMFRSVQRARVRVDQGLLIVHTGVGSKRIPLTNLRAHGLQLVNFSTHPELRPIIKLWGTGLPGFAGGWFKLRNGDKAVCLLLDRHAISYLRSDADQLTVLLSLAEPEKLRALIER